jgi:hypothetical protein
VTAEINYIVIALIVSGIVVWFFSREGKGWGNL